MATNTNNTPKIIPLTSTSIYSVNMNHVSKLDSTNYLMWSLQVHSHLDGYGLATHLDEFVAVPAATTMTNEVLTVNSEYTKWSRQDKLIYSALIGAISIPLQPVVARTTSASQIWAKLEATYAKPSRGHIRQLKMQIKAWTKGNRKIDEYVQGLITRFDQLALLGKPMDHEDQVEHILVGLPEGFKPVVDQIEAKDQAPSITEVHERLLNHESKLLSVAATTSFPAPVTAHAVQHNNSNNNRFNNPNNRRYNHNNNNTNWQPNQNQSQPDSRMSKPYLGKCQYCNTQGHSARKCP